MAQTTQAKNEVQNTSTMASALSGASNIISSSIGGVGDLASKVLGLTGSGIGELGGLIQRMTNSPSAKPTPVESYVSMVTKHDATGMGRAEQGTEVA